MKYKNAVIKILDEYIDIINKDEIKILISILKKIENIEDNKIPDEIIMFINKILDRIWNLYISDIKTFKNGDQFKFLIKDIINFFKSNDNTDLIDTNKNNYKIIDNKNIIEKDIEEYGLVILPNYTNNLRTQPIFPSDFNNKEIVLDKFNYIICGYYCIDTKLDNLDINFSIIKNLSKKSNVDCIIIDKNKYMIDEKNKNKDISSIHKTFIYNYLLNTNTKLELISARNFYIKKTKKDFYKLYNKLCSKKITVYQFKELVNMLLNSVDIDNEKDICYINEVKK